MVYLIFQNRILLMLKVLESKVNHGRQNRILQRCLETRVLENRGFGEHISNAPKGNGIGATGS